MYKKMNGNKTRLKQKKPYITETTTGGSESFIKNTVLYLK